MPRSIRASAQRRTRTHVLGLSLALTASMGLVGLAPGLSGPAHAAPVEDCAVPFPVESLVDGQAVEGLTVSEGTTPEAFTGTFLGVLENGIAPGLDMIMMRLDSPAIQQAGGIWQGMSGSPVYDPGTGELIGAVAYGLAWGTTPVAGITPFADMDDYLSASGARKVDVTRAEARLIAANSDATVAQASAGFRRLGIPLGASAVVDPARTADAPERKAYFVDPTFTLSGGGPQGVASIDSVAAGGSLAAVQATGDVTFAGIGTTTSVCQGEVVGFGHPMSFAGETSYALGAADVLYVQEDPLGVPFKVANIGDIGGTITGDHLTGITGELGAAPPAVPFTSDLAYGTRSRVGTTDVYMPEALASASFYGSLGNHDRVVDAITDGSELQSWTVEGTDEAGAPFTLMFGDRITSTWDVSYEASYPLADVLWILSSFEGVTITEASSTGTVTDDASSYRVRTVQQRVDGEWVRVVDNRVRAKAGSTLRLRATLVSGAESTVVPITVALPKKLAGERGSLQIEGGDSDWIDVYGVETVAEMVDVYADAPRNDQVATSVSFGRDGRKFSADVLSAIQEKVVGGRRSIELVVR